MLSLGIVLVLTAATVLLAAGPAAAKEWRVSSMDVLLDVQASGDVLVTENVTFVFAGSFSYVSRVIPTDALAGIEDVQVLQDGRPLPRGDAPGSYDVFKEGKDLVVQLAFALSDTSASWTIRYRAKSAVAFYDETDELVWHVFDAESPVPIDRVTTKVHLPGAVAAEDLEWAVDTAMNVKSTVSSPAASTVAFDAAAFPPNTKYWVAVGFPKGTVEYSWTPRRLVSAVVPRAGFLLPIAAFLGMTMVWFRRGRDEPAAAFAKYVTEPPSALPPAAVGALLDERVDTKELFATLADLARRGYLELPETHTKSTSWQIRKLKSIADLEGLDALVAGKLFASGDEKVKSPTLQKRIGSLAATFDEAVFKDLLRRGFFAQTPAAAKSQWKTRAWKLIGLLALITIGLGFTGIGGWGFFALGSVFAAAVVFGFARVMPQRTRAGAAEQRKWQAFRNYLEDLTEFQDLAVAQETFEAHLPYAIAFGVEKRWIRRFEALAKVPGWLAPMAGAYPTTTADRRTKIDETADGATGRPGPSIGVGMDDLKGGLRDLAHDLSSVTLSSASDGLFSGLDKLSSAIMSAPSSTGSGRGSFGSSRVTSGGSSSSSSSFSGGGSSSGGSGFSSSGGGGGGGGFRAG